jgi:hypothetical protein
MNDIIRQFLKESIAIELNIGDLYQLFSVKFPQDYNFWWKISIEEMNHAALIESINDVFLYDSSLLSPDSIGKLTEDLRKMNLSIIEQIEIFKFGSSTRAEAFKLAYELENSIGEFHFELFMTGKSNSMVVKILQKLNGDDINHAQRIETYVKEYGIG